MRNTFNVFNFEFKNQIKKAGFWVTTIILMIIILVVTSIPTIIGFFPTGNENVEGAGASNENIVSEENNTDVDMYGKYLADDSIDKEILASKFPFSVMEEAQDLEQLRSEVLADQIPAAVIINDREIEVIFKVETFQNTATVYSNGFKEVLNTMNLAEAGLDPEQVESLLVEYVPITVTSLEKSPLQNFFFSYFGILAIYMIILLYGSSVSSMIANEKSSRTMEILVTNTSASSLIWGKVTAAFVAALLQILTLLVTVLVGVTINKHNYSDFVLSLLQSNLKIDHVIVFLVCALLGFLLYLFIFAACGAIVSRIEDLSKAIMPVTMIIIIGFFFAISSLSGSSDSTLLTIGSYIPFTSPYMMFSRYVSFGVSISELLVSLGILVLTIFFIAWICTKIYRNATLNYGNKPSLFAEIKKLFSRN